MSFRALCRLITAVALVTAYIALHLAITAGLDLRTSERFRDAPARAAAFVAALDRYAGGDPSASADILHGDAWFAEHGRRTASATVVSLAADSALEGGGISVARAYLDDLTMRIEQDQAEFDHELSSSGAVAVRWGLAAAALGALALWLRHRRRASAAEVVEVISRFTTRAPRWRRPVFLAVSAIGYPLLVTGFLAGVAAIRSNELSWGIRGIVLLGGLATVLAGTLVLRFSRPRSARGAADALRADGRKPVLYLRSFADDQVSAQVDRIGAPPDTALAIHSREEQLAAALGAFGPVIAVARPGEPLPYLGAARFSLPDDQWQSGVRRLMDLSQLIVLRLGSSEGLRWEIEQARTTQPTHKLVLLVPGETWTSAVITYDAGWNPHEYPVGPAPGAKNRPGTPAQHMVRAMQAALAAVGVRRRAMVLRANIGMLTALGKGLLIVPAFVLLVRLLQLVGLW